MQTIEKQTEEINSTDLPKLIEMSIFRTEKGISLYLKSGIIEDFVRSQVANPDHIDSTIKAHCTTSPNQGWQMHRGYVLPDSVPQLQQMRNWGGQIHSGGNNGANLSFLTTKGLRNGVTFEFEGLFSQPTIEKYLRDAKNQIKSLYNEFIKQRNTTLEITIREID